MSRTLANPSGYALKPGGGSLFDLPPEVAEVSVPIHANATDTEQAAAENIAPIAGTLRALVLEWVTAAGGVAARGVDRLGLCTKRSD